MTEKRWLYFALGVTTVISVGAVTNQLVPLAPLPNTIETDGTIQADGFVYSGQGVGTLGQVEAAGGFKFSDGTVQMTAAPRDPRRAFYLTSDLTQGGPGGFLGGPGPLDACAGGYHMAQLWEILDVSNLRYATEVPGALSSGYDGPIPQGVDGWIRTGNTSSQDSVFADAGRANCDLWTDPDADDFANGTVVSLSRTGAYWGVEASAAQDFNGWLGPWVASAIGCYESARVWCVEDYPGAAA